MEDLENLDVDDFKMLEKDLKTIPYKRLLQAMAERGFANVPSVPTRPPHPHGSSSL